MHLSTFSSRFSRARSTPPPSILKLLICTISGPNLVRISFVARRPARTYDSYFEAMRDVMNGIISWMFSKLRTSIFRPLAKVWLITSMMTGRSLFIILNVLITDWKFEFFQYLMAISTEFFRYWMVCNKSWCYSITS